MHSVKNVPEIFTALGSAGVPDRFTHEFLKQLGFTSSNDRAFPAVLKTLRFLDDNGVPTDRYRRYRDASIARAVMAEALRDAYSDLFKVNEKAQDMTNANLTGAVKRITGKTDSVSQKIASTFKALSKLADWSGGTPIAAATAPDVHDEPPTTPPDATPTTVPELGPSLLPSLHHDVHIHLPVSTNVQVYDAIFRSLREHFR